jgi:hypothetical protein
MTMPPRDESREPTDRTGEHRDWSPADLRHLAAELARIGALPTVQVDGRRLETLADWTDGIARAGPAQLRLIQRILRDEPAEATEVNLEGIEEGGA